MSNKTAPKKAKTAPQTRAVVLHDTQLAPRQLSVIQATTPAEFVQEKPGRGGKKVKYVEGGYVIAQLNAAFSPAGWEFKITERGETQRQNEKNTEGEVWVYGELTIIDHLKGYRVTKGQYGQHPIHKNVPIGDALKSASTDALKKCASLFGIALDVYWGQIEPVETSDKNKSKEQGAKLSPAEMFARAKTMIASTKNPAVLIAYAERLPDSKNFSKDQKSELNKIISRRVDELENEKN